MAKTYYKPQPVAAQTQINWAEVGKDFSDMLSEDKRVKDEKKAAIDEDTRQQMKNLNSVELTNGQAPSANEWWLNASGEITNAMQMANGLLKSGQLNITAYTKMMQNINDGTDGLIGVFDKFKNEYNLKKERMGCNDPEGVGCSQKLEYWAMEQLESMGNFQNTAVVVNPDTGSFSVADLVEGKIVNDPNKVRSINTLQTMAGSEFNLFDLDAATAAFADKAGTFQRISRTASTATQKGIKTITTSPMFNGEFSEDDIKLLEDTDATPELIAELKAQGNIYFAAEQQLVQTIMANDLQSTSILTNSIGSDDDGNDYDFTFNKERGENEILMKQEGNALVPDFTDEIGKRQLEKVKKFIKTDTRNQLDKKETSTVEDTGKTPPKKDKESDSTKKIKGEKVRQGELAQSIYNYLTSTDVNDLNRLESEIKAFNNKVETFKKIGTDIIIDFRDAKGGDTYTETISVNNTSIADLNATLLNLISPTSVTDPKNIVSNSVTTRENEEISTESQEDTKIDKQGAIQSFSEELAFPDDVFVQDEGDKTATNVNSFINSLSYSGIFEGNLKAVGGEEGFATDYITIKYTPLGGEEIELDKINVDKGGKGEFNANFKNQIISILQEYMVESDFEKYNKAQGGTGGAGGTGAKRSIADIMREDGVSRAEAGVIFKNENQ